MAELSGFWTTSGTPSGDQQASYTQAQLAIAHAIMAACSGFEGVAPGYLNELACADAGANTVSVATGGAMVDGLWFNNDASQNVNIPSASGGGNTRIDRIVLRADWANFNVSVHRIAGTDAASPTPPAVTQNSGTTYDIKLCQVLVDTGGDVTVTDEREWAAAEVDDATLEVHQGSGRLQVKDAGIVAAKIASSAVETAKINNLAVTSGKLAANAVIAGKVADGAINTTAKLANDIVDDTKAGNRLVKLLRRIGGNASNWFTTGTTEHTPTAINQFVGSALSGTINAGQAGNISITFPIAFADVPLVWAFNTSGVLDWDLTIQSISNTSVTFRARNNSGTNQAITINWMAIGPE